MSKTYKKIIAVFTLAMISANAIGAYGTLYGENLTSSQIKDEVADLDLNQTNTEDVFEGEVIINESDESDEGEIDFLFENQKEDVLIDDVLVDDKTKLDSEIITSKVKVTDLNLMSEWINVNVDTTSIDDLQVLIQQAGSTPTKFVLYHSLTRTEAPDLSKPGALYIAKGQKIHISGANSSIVIDSYENGITSHATFFVQDGGTLLVDNVVITGGNRTKDLGGGGGVLVGGGGGHGLATFIMGENTVIKNNKAGFGGGVYVALGSYFEMNGGVIAENVADAKGGGVFAFNDTKIVMNNGIIRDNISDHTKGGGNGVYIEGSESNPSTFEMHNGKITNTIFPHVKRGGGGVRLKHAKFDMYNGEISHYVGNGEGGGVGVFDSVFNMWEGQIHSNDNYYGGAVLVRGRAATTGVDSIVDSTFNMYGGVIGGTDEAKGNIGDYGAVTLGDASWGSKGGIFNMYSGLITHNTRGGALSITNNGRAIITGDSKIEYNNGNYQYPILVSKGSLTLSGNATVNSNYSKSDGGAVFLVNADFFLKDEASLISNKSEGNGGAIAALSSNVNLLSGLINDNHSQKNGGAIYSSNSKIDLGEVFITNNSAKLNGGGIYTDNYGKLVLSSENKVTFSGNTAQYIGMAEEIPQAAIWNGEITSTSVDNVEFKGKYKDILDDYIFSGGVLNNLISFNNFDINMVATDYYYLVEFDSDGGSNVPSQLITDDGSGKVETPENPTKPGYIFDGWLVDVQTNVVYNFDNAVTSNLKLTARWIKNLEVLNVKDITIYEGDAWSQLDHVIEALDYKGNPLDYNSLEYIGLENVNSAKYGVYTFDIKNGEITKTVKLTVLKLDDDKEEPVDTVSPDDNNVVPPKNDQVTPKTGLENLSFFFMITLITSAATFVLLSKRKKINKY